jgi:L-arabinose isomerase
MKMSSPQRKREMREAWEESQRREEQERFNRIREVWQVPECAAEALVALGDIVGGEAAAKTADLIKAMLEGAR